MASVKTIPSGSITETDISAMVQWPSVNVHLITTKQVSSANFDIKNIAGRTLPTIGDTINIYDGVTLIFGGKITDKKLLVDGGISTRYQYSCVDWSFDFDKMSVVKTYTNQDPGTIVADIISTYCSGFSSVHVSTAGYTIPSIAFNYQPPTKCLQKIAQMIGWDWYIDPQKNVYFFDASLNPAPYSITDTSNNVIFDSIALETSLQNLKNSVYVIGGNYSFTFTSVTTPDVYATDATALIYPLAYSYDPATVSVTVDGVAKTVGIDQKDNPASFNVLYNAGQNGVGAFLRWPTVVGAAHTLKAFGNASIPVLGHASDSSSITSYGEYQDSIVDKLITTVAEAQKRAQAEILQYGQPNYILSFKTLSSGLMPGQTITINSTIMGIARNFVIKSVRLSCNTPTEFMYEVQAEAAISVSFVDIMTLLLEGELMQNQVANSTILETLLIVAEAAAVSDSLTVTTQAGGAYKWGDGSLWGFATWNA